MFVYIYTYICWNKVSLVQKKAVKRIFFLFFWSFLIVKTQKSTSEFTLTFSLLVYCI